MSLPDIDYGLQRSMRTGPRRVQPPRLGDVVHVTSEFMEALARAVLASCRPYSAGHRLSRIAFDGERPEGPPWRLLQVASSTE